MLLYIRALKWLLQPCLKCNTRVKEVYVHGLRYHLHVRTAPSLLKNPPHPYLFRQEFPPPMLWLLFFSPLPSIILLKPNPLPPSEGGPPTFPLSLGMRRLICKQQEFPLDSGRVGKGGRSIEGDPSRGRDGRAGKEHQRERERL